MQSRKKIILKYIWNYNWLSSFWLADYRCDTLIQETLKMSDPFQICTWEFPINCHQIPKTLSPSSQYFISYWGFISLTQTEENSTDETHLEPHTMHDLKPIFILKTTRYKIILVPNQSIYIFLYIKIKIFH